MNERKLIYANDLKKELIERNFFPAIVKSALEILPAVNAVEVIRCKDCKRYVENKEAFVTYCRRGLQDRHVKPYDFCSYGERKVRIEGEEK